MKPLMGNEKPQDCVSLSKLCRSEASMLIRSQRNQNGRGFLQKHGMCFSIMYSWHVPFRICTALGIHRVHFQSDDTRLDSTTIRSGSCRIVVDRMKTNPGIASGCDPSQLCPRECQRCCRRACSCCSSRQCKFTRLTWHQASQ